MKKKKKLQTKTEKYKLHVHLYIRGGGTNLSFLENFSYVLTK